MKKYLIILSICILSQSCQQTQKELNKKIDFQIQLYENYIFSNDTFKTFVEDYINMPENEARKVFTLYIDQRMDTLLFTIWKNSRIKFDLENSFGYFFSKNKAIIIYSPFFKIFEINIDTIDQNIISKLHNEDVEYYKTHKQESIMWQLQIPVHGNDIHVEKDYKKIHNTAKPPAPENYYLDSDSI